MQTLNRHQFDLAVKPLRPAMVKAARARVGQVWAEDAVQEALLQAWTIIDRFDASSGSSAFAAWMREILEIVC
ncbi:sigma factor, partial [Salmonella enterica]|uniref:sigma factor n=1 Tax=Salmonella enterica TaxID=28901 RepID=UPI003D28BF46